MTENETRAEAERLGISLENPTPEALERAIQRELLDLQQDDISDAQAERRRVLTEALSVRASLPESKPSTEVVTISAAALTDLLQSVVGSQSGRPATTPEERMRTGVLVQATQARKDFRNARTLPFIGLGAIAAFAWTQRDSLGINSENTTPLWFGALLAAGIVTAGFFFLLSWAQQQRDEQILQRLYLPDAQAQALVGIGRQESFMLPAYREELAHVTRVPLRRRLAFNLSTVDLNAALLDAAELAIERFVKLEVVEPVRFFSGLEYRRSPKFGNS